MKAYRYFEKIEVVFLLQAIIVVVIFSVIGYVVASPKASEPKDSESLVAGVSSNYYKNILFEPLYSSGQDTAVDYYASGDNQYVIEVTPRFLQTGSKVIDLIKIANQEKSIVDLQFSIEVLGIVPDSLKINLINGTNKASLFNDKTSHAQSIKVNSLDKLYLRLEYLSEENINYSFAIRIYVKY